MQKIKCKSCGAAFSPSSAGSESVYCSNACRQRGYRERKLVGVSRKGVYHSGTPTSIIVAPEGEAHTAENIKIDPSHVWENKSAETLAAKYCTPIEFIQRGLEVSRLCNTPITYFIQRYLLGDKTVPFDQTFNDVYMQHMKDTRPGW